MDLKRKDLSNFILQEKKIMSSLVKRRTQTKQFEIENLDEMVWSSTPLGRFMNSTNNRTAKVITSYELKTSLDLGSFVSLDL